MTTALSEMLGESGVPQEKRTKLAETMEGMMGSIVDQAISKSDLRWEARCEEMMSRFMTKVDEKLAASDKRSDAKFEEILKRLSLVEQENKELKSSVSSAGSVAGGGSGQSNYSTTASERDFRPRKVEVKGYIEDWDKRHEQALTLEEVKAWLVKVSAELAEEAKMLIDPKATLETGSRVMFTRIEIRLIKSASREDAWILKKGLDRVLATDAGQIRGLNPYVVVEASPSKKPYLQAGGRFLGLLEKKGIKKPSVKAEWGPPLRIYDTRTSKPALVAKFDVSTGWAIQEAAFESLVPGTKVEDVMADLRK